MPKLRCHGTWNTNTGELRLLKACEHLHGARKLYRGSDKCLCRSVQLMQKLGQAGVTVYDYHIQFGGWLEAAKDFDHLPRGVRLE